MDTVVSVSDSTFSLMASLNCSVTSSTLRVVPSGRIPSSAVAVIVTPLTVTDSANSGWVIPSTSSRDATISSSSATSSTTYTVPCPVRLSASAATFSASTASSSTPLAVTEVMLNPTCGFTAKYRFSPSLTLLLPLTVAVPTGSTL